ncbi:TPA: cyclic nucleotide-binding domain-containing protein [Burkholderia multivorans]|uniref:cyclic nucleotide-binding domain-containing protein n=1 Tax=Burkholderia multivorans TaxID=87883 RepID=UPI000CFF25F5|nr:cyclic nucleotide-binding domain-containing protein [Burkholderia multivorans]MBU9299862.1 cyclic nucleotide-binding domain-containing protein [Burkholderia multivorans]MBU9303320.1 cyclic nucleotide-binding domain-containing protein [Burkholderia multivorans]MBU9501142.1 cyclic nucleotide-binding domain-containing protein [Burkholderia multivorans]MBU9504955.1 cyclic nucleotide-binding domain-containing protein [Burkholderia multivorans]MCA8458780.1 cyclic nucleotide-binding domain-contain
MNRQQSWTRTAAPGEIIYAEGYAGEPVIFLIADGKVELSTRCDDQRVVLATLGRGEFFGEAALLAVEPRAHTAKALSFCQLTVVPTSVLDEEIERVSALLRHIVRTSIRRVKRKDDQLATYTHADFMPGVLSYAHVLALMGDGTARETGDTWARRPLHVQAELASVPLVDVIRKCRAIAGHSRPHVMAMLRRMEKLNLVTIEASSVEAGGVALEHSASADARQVVTFDAARIVDRAQQVADHDLDLSINSELELIELADLESLIGVDRKLLLNKLAHGEIADDVFAFRKSKVLSFVERKGVAYFSRRDARRAADVRALEDLVWVDQRTLFEIVSAFDTYDLAKLIANVDDRAVADRLFSVMTEVRRNEVSWVMRRDLKVDPVEVDDIERRLLDAVRAAKAPAAGAVPTPESGA